MERVEKKKGENEGYRQRAVQRRRKDWELETHRKCKRCEETHEITMYNKHASGTRGRDSVCKICKQKINRKSKLKIHYNITPEDYDILAEAQESLCAICNDHTKLYIDHDHKGNHVRGLLCRECNTMLGMAKDSIETLLAAADYLISDRLITERIKYAKCQ